jgi:hypothetical protein
VNVAAVALGKDTVPVTCGQPSRSVLQSVNELELTVESFIVSLNTAVIDEVVETPVAPLAGFVLVTPG